MSSFEIRAATAQEFSIAIDWAAAEGWNPGIDDLAPFFKTDPDGFIMGFLDGVPLSSVSVVRYEEDYGFLGFYIVRPEYRGLGYGLQTWNAGLKHLENRTIGLDGVVDQQENYRKSGFILTGRNIRHSGVPAIETVDFDDGTILDMRQADRASLLAYDQSFFAQPRDIFTAAWSMPGRNGKRITKLAQQDGEIVGYGTIRECRQGYKIGPLFAEKNYIAEALFSKLVHAIPEGSEISLDTPQDNADAAQLAHYYGLKPVFETARMYKGDAPNLPISKIFGVTTFELG